MVCEEKILAETESLKAWNEKLMLMDRLQKEMTGPAISSWYVAVSKTEDDKRLGELMSRCFSPVSGILQKRHPRIDWLRLARPRPRPQPP